MARNHLRSVVSAWQTEDETPANSHGNASLELGGEVAEQNFENYDPRAFYLRASDENGHVINIQVTIPTNWGPALQQLIDSEANQYKSRVEVARDALIHGLVRRLMETGLKDPEEAWFAEVHMLHLRHTVEGQKRYVDGLADDLEMHAAMENWSAVLDLTIEAQGVRLPAALRRQRDTLVERYQARVPKNYRASYEVE